MAASAEPAGSGQQPPGSEPQVGPTWDAVLQTLQIIGAGAALVGWIAVVGGARVYLRFEAAQLPSPLRTVSVVPRDTLLAEGLHALAIPLALGAAVALVTYLVLSRRERADRDAEIELERRFDPRFRGPGAPTISRDERARYLKWRALRTEGAYQRGLARMRADMRQDAPRARPRAPRSGYLVPSVLAGLAIVVVVFALVPRTLWIALLVAGVAVVGAAVWLALALRLRPPRVPDRLTQGTAPLLGSIGFLLLAVLFFVLLRAFGVSWLWALVVTVGFPTTVFILTALYGETTAARFSLALFAAIAFFAGLVAVVREDQKQGIDVNRARAVLTDPSETIPGWFVARSGDDLYIALPERGSVTDPGAAQGPKRLKIIPKDRVVQLYIGADPKIPPIKREGDTRPVATITSPTTVTTVVTEPGKTVTEPGKTVTDPGKTVTDPGKTVTDPGKTVTDPGKTVTTPGKTVTQIQTVTATQPPPSQPGARPPAMPTALATWFVPDRRGTFSVAVGQFTEPVTGSLNLVTRAKIRTAHGLQQASISTKPFHSRPDGRVHVQVHLSSRLSRALRDRGHLDVDAYVVARGIAGLAGHTEGCIVLLAAPPKAAVRCAA
jgi:hypothetical protein